MRIFFIARVVSQKSNEGLSSPEFSRIELDVNPRKRSRYLRPPSTGLRSLAPEARQRLRKSQQPSPAPQMSQGFRVRVREYQRLCQECHLHRKIHHLNQLTDNLHYPRVYSLALDMSWSIQEIKPLLTGV